MSRSYNSRSISWWRTSSVFKCFVLRVRRVVLRLGVLSLWFRRVVLSKRTRPCTLSRTWWRSPPASTAGSRRWVSSLGPEKNKNVKRSLISIDWYSSPPPVLNLDIFLKIFSPLSLFLNWFSSQQPEDYIASPFPFVTLYFFLTAMILPYYDKGIIYHKLNWQISLVISEI